MNKMYLGLLILLVFACAKDKTIEEEPAVCEEEVTYNNQMETLFLDKCTFSGCHVGNPAGDYRDLSILQGDIDKGAMTSRVFQVGDMPRNDSLTEEEFELFTCWRDQGYRIN